MGLRDLMRDHPALFAGMAIVVLALAVWRGFGGSSAPLGRWYYYDTSTGELVASDELPPATLPSGAIGISAHVFACGSCDTDEHFVGYLERLTEEGEAYRRKAEASDEPVDSTIGSEIAAMPEKGEQPKWFNIASPQAAAIQNVRSRCPNRDAVECRPTN